MIYLYHFSHYSKPLGGALLEEWAHTSNALPVSSDAYPGLVFTPAPGLTHSDVRYDSGKSAGQCNVTVARSHPVAALFAGGYPAGSVYLRIIEADSSDPDALSNVIWRGRIRTCDFSELTASLTGTDGSERLQRLGLRLNAGTACQWSLFDSDCSVDEATYTRSGTVTAVSPSGLEITTTLSEPDSFFAAGKFKFAGQTRMVLKSTSAGVLTLMTAIAGLAPGAAITATKGCDRSPSAERGCKSFSNYQNYSGFEGFETPRNIFAEGA